MTILPSIQGNHLRRETTETGVKLLHRHAIRPESGHPHDVNLLGKVVVLQRLKTCKSVGQEVPKLVRLDPSRAVDYVILDNKVLREVLARRISPRISLDHRRHWRWNLLEPKTGCRGGSQPCLVLLP